MSNEDTNDYDKLKKTLLTMYNFTEDGYRLRFRDVKSETEETPDQFVVRLKNYLAKWLETFWKQLETSMLWWISWSKNSLSTPILTS